MPLTPGYGETPADPEDLDVLTDVARDVVGDAPTKADLYNLGSDGPGRSLGRVRRAHRRRPARPGRPARRSLRSRAARQALQRHLDVGNVSSVLLDDETLLEHRDLWVPEPIPAEGDSPHPMAPEAQTLALLRLKGNVRLDQERIDRVGCRAPANWA